ncbi:MAG: hypothetical protein K6F37_05480 [Lachnospiraceae bacterium]|nr:hypothetical protein [Lachnospiraceae bacterium]
MKFNELKKGQRIKIRAYNKEGEVTLWSTVLANEEYRTYIKGLNKDGSLITFPPDKIKVEIVVVLDGVKYTWDKVEINIEKKDGIRCYYVDGMKKGKSSELKKKQKMTHYTKECTITYKNKPEVDEPKPGVTRFLSRSKLEIISDDTGAPNDQATILISMDEVKPIEIEVKITKKAEGEKENGTQLYIYECALMKPSQAYFSLIDTL